MQNEINMLETWNEGGPSDLQILLDRQQATLAQADDTLREQRIEIERMLDKLEALHNSLHDIKNQGMSTLVEENDFLRRQLQERPSGRDSINDTVSPNALKEIESLHAENKLLRRLLDEKEQTIEEMKNQESAQPAEENDLANYEAELNRFRKQLAEDRTKLNAEIEALRFRNQELDEATREMEMEMSRERAEIARERARLDRMRDEVRNEVERMQRDGGMRASLAPVQRLRDQLNTKKS